MHRARENSQTEEILIGVWVEGATCRSSMPLRYPPSKPMRSSTWELIESHCSKSFYRAQSTAPLTRTWRSVGRAESSNPLSTWPFCTRLILKLSRGSHLSHLISINSATTERGTPISQEIPRLLGASCQE